jgi:hypothetical protein
MFTLDNIMGVIVCALIASMVIYVIALVVKDEIQYRRGQKQLTKGAIYDDEKFWKKLRNNK